MEKFIDLNLPPPVEVQSSIRVVDLNLPPIPPNLEENIETLDSIPVPSRTFDPYFFVQPPVTELLTPPTILFQEDPIHYHEPYFDTHVYSSGPLYMFPQNHQTNEIGFENLGFNLDDYYSVDPVDSLMFDVFGDDYTETRDEILFEEAMGMFLDAVVDGDGEEEEEEEIMLENDSRDVVQDLMVNPEHGVFDFAAEVFQFYVEPMFEGNLFEHIMIDDDEDNVRVGNPSATNFIQNLPSVSLTEEQMERNNVCAICMDDFSLEEKVTLLPCSHYFHGNCILPWLNTENTCPFCRYEFPTNAPVVRQYDLNIPPQQ